MEAQVGTAGGTVLKAKLGEPPPPDVPELSDAGQDCLFL